MDEPPFIFLYRPAAILAAFSRASDEVVCDAVPYVALSHSPDRDSALETAGKVLRSVLASAVERAGKSRAVRAQQSVAWTGADASAPWIARSSFGSTTPALASHFDFCHTAELERDAASVPGRQAA